MSNHKSQSFNTLAIHAGEAPDPLTGAIAPVLVRSKTFAQKEFGVESTYQYSRGKNPTRVQLEEKLAILEGGGKATVFATGVAAEASFFLTLSPGDHLVCCREVYGGTFRLLTKLLNRFGIEADFIDFDDEEKVLKAIKPNTKYLFVETVTNPSLTVVDLELVARISKKSGIPFVVDATFTPPNALRPFDYGAETVIHSLSKYIAGHNDILGGAVITKNPALAEQLFFIHRSVGAVLSPDECYRVLQEVKTLPLRWERASQTAQKVAEYLEKQLAVKKVYYPGLRSNPQYELAHKHIKNGFGAVVSFVLHEEGKDKLKKFIDAIRDNSHIVYGESLASPETIIAYPPTMSHGSVPRDVRYSLGITDGFFRLSVGLEAPEDIIIGLSAGLRAVRR